MSRVESKKAFLGCDNVRNIGYIEDVMVNILSRLPVKHLQPCKLVCMFWYRLISEPQFAQLQFTRSPKKQKYIMHLDYSYKLELGKRLYIMNRTGKISPYVIVPILDENYFFEVVCSFNGLLCFVKHLGDNDLNIHICNPANSEMLKLPQGSPSTRPLSVGVVFYPNKNKYKVLRFFSDTSPECRDTAQKIEIYSPGDVGWRVIPGAMEPPLNKVACLKFPISVSIGKRMYWLVWLKQEIPMPDYICSIDMDENITRIRLPRRIAKPKGNTDKYFKELHIFNIFTLLIEYKGRLGLVSVDYDEMYVYIWSLYDPVESCWIFEGRADLEFDGVVPNINSIVSIGDELMFIMSNDWHTFQFLNLPKTWRRPELAFSGNAAEDFSVKYSPTAFPFSESLFRCDATD